MIGAVGMLVDGQGAAHYALGFGQAAGGMEQLREIVESNCDSWIVLASTLLEDRKRTPHQRLGLGQPVGGFKQLSEVVELSGDVGMVRAKAPFFNSQCLSEQQLSLPE